MQLVVSDTSPIRALVHLDLLHLLPQLYAEVMIPPAVVHELEHPKSRAPAIQIAAERFVHVRRLASFDLVARLRKDLHEGEAEAIALAVEISADALLIDEKAGRQIAIRHGLRTIGTLGVLVEAKRAGLISVVRPLVERLRLETRFYVTDQLFEDVLRLAGE